MMKGLGLFATAMGIFFASHHSQLQGTPAVLTQAQSSVEHLLDNYSWRNRVLLIFAPSSGDARLLQQNKILASVPAGLSDRDMVILRFINGQKNSINGRDHATWMSQPFYDYFDVEPGGFTAILLGKDGTEKLRQSSPITVQTLFALIDSMPMRQQEMRQR